MGLIARNLNTGAIVASNVAVADTRATRAVGLLTRDGLNPGEALWIVPSRGVHTCWMRFTIDVVALDDQGVVVDRVARLKPWRIRLPRRGTAGVLELPAGQLEATGHADRASHRARHRRCAVSAGAVDPRRVADRGRETADAAGAARHHRGDRPAPRHAVAADAEDAGRRRGLGHGPGRGAPPAVLGARRDDPARPRREARRSARRRAAPAARDTATS